jgi:hypothetical protein
MLKDKIDIDILVTLDPVSRTIKPKARPKPSAAGKWINVYANLSTKGPDNTIAKIGGPWGSQSNADVNKPSGARHREAQDMLNSVARDLLTSLLNIEKNKKKESTSNTQTA